MRDTSDIGFVRTDIWREGNYVDTWSIVHFLSGISLAFGMWYLHFPTNAAFVIAVLLLTAYEMFEVIAKIEETVTNRISDVVFGMLSFVPVTLWILPHLSLIHYFEFGIPLFALNMLLSIVGWKESQKAYELEKKVRAEIAKEREKLIERKNRIKARIQARKPLKRAAPDL